MKTTINTYKYMRVATINVLDNNNWYTVEVSQCATLDGQCTVDKAQVKTTSYGSVDADLALALARGYLEATRIAYEWDQDAGKVVANMKELES